MTKITQVVEPLTSEILFIDPLGTESRRLMKQIQKLDVTIYLNSNFMPLNLYSYIK